MLHNICIDNNIEIEDDEYFDPNPDDTECEEIEENAQNLIAINYRNDYIARFIR